VPPRAAFDAAFIDALPPGVWGHSVADFADAYRNLAPLANNSAAGPNRNHASFRTFPREPTCRSRSLPRQVSHGKALPTMPETVSTRAFTGIRSGEPTSVMRLAGRCQSKRFDVEMLRRANHETDRPPFTPRFLSPLTDWASPFRASPSSIVALPVLLVLPVWSSRSPPAILGSSARGELTDVGEIAGPKLGPPSWGANGSPGGDRPRLADKHLYAWPAVRAASAIG